MTLCFADEGNFVRVFLTGGTQPPRPLIETALVVDVGINPLFNIHDMDGLHELRY